MGPPWRSCGPASALARKHRQATKDGLDQGPPLAAHRLGVVPAQLIPGPAGGRRGRRAVAGAADAVRRGEPAVLGAAADAGRAVRGPGSPRKLGLVAPSAGAVAGAASFLAPHSAISGTGRAVAAAAVQAVAWARRTFRALVTG